MTGPDGTAVLADFIAQRSAAQGDLPVLILGSAVGEAAGAPPAAEVARTLFDQLRTSSTEPPFALPEPDAGDAELVRAFHELLTELPAVQRTSVTLGASAAVPVPQFLQDVALLIRELSIPVVVTTNYDTLLERALGAVGLRAGADLRVVDVGAEVTPRSSRTSEGDDPLVTLLKLHAQPLHGANDLPGVDLMRSVVVVGHVAGDPPIIDALAWGGEPLWWVSVNPPAGADLRTLKRAPRETTVVLGDAADPDRFFGELAMRLLQMPTLNLLASPADALTNARDAGLLQTRVIDTDTSQDPPSSVFAKIGGTHAPDGASFEKQLVRWRIARCRRLLARLERQAEGGVLDDALRIQLEYQQKLLTELDQRLHSLEASREVISKVLSDIQAAPQVKGDRETAAYLGGLVDQIEAQYQREIPNEAVISATLGAVSIFADRIGVEPTLVHTLNDQALGSSWRIA